MAAKKQAKAKPARTKRAGSASRAVRFKTRKLSWVKAK